MRITNNTMTNNFLSSINKSLEKENNIQTQLADGKAIHNPSDDPVKAVRSLQYSTSLALNQQYSQNAQDAQSWMQTTDNAMQDLSSIMNSVKEQVVQASNGTNTQADVQAIGANVDGLINQMINIGNTKLGDRYVFAGQKDKTTPFTLASDGGSVNYAGDTGKISMPIQPGVASPTQDSVNLTGEDVFGSGMSIMKNLLEIKKCLQSGTTADQQWLSTTGLANLDVDHSQMLQAETALGSRMSMYTSAANTLDSNNNVITQNQSTNDDVDVTKAIMDFKNSQNVYTTALQVGAKIMPTSLADFLK